MARIERLRGAIEAARNNSNKPLSVRLRDQATQQLSKIRAEVNSLTSKAHQVIVNVKTNGSEKLKGIKNSISEGVGGAAMAAGATMLGSAGIGYGVVNAVQSQMNFEKSLSKVKALMVSGRTEEETNQVMTMLTAKAEELGAQTKFTAAEVAEGMRYQAIAGWTPEQIEAGIKPLTSLAAAGDLNLQQTSDILTDSLTAFGLKAGEFVNVNGKMVEASKHFADLMTATFTKSNTDIQMLGEASKYAAPVVNALYSNASASEKMMAAQDTFLLMGLQANAGVKSSQSGTSTRAILTRLASSQRNANFASRGLGVSLKDEATGEARPLIDFFSDLRKVFSEGVDLDKITGVFEEMSGEKIHADTRRKLQEYYENVQRSGGKLTGMDKTKMGAMLAGQEAMSGLLAILTASEQDFNKIKEALDNADGLTDKIAEIQLDNLAGSVTLLGSAWDAFQRSFVKGSAGEGLRSFVDSITDSLSKANKLFEDGIDFSDLVTLGADAVTKLKNKFLELDGIGSLLAGGALFWGLKKIASMALSVKDTLGTLTKARTMSDVGNVIRGNKTAGGLPSATGAMNVTASTMNVRAGVVNVSGGVQAGAAGGRGATVLTNQQRVNDYYARRQQILTSGTTVAGGIGAAGAGAAAQGGKLAALRGAGGVIGGAGLMAGIFGIMDVISTRANSNYTNQAANEKLAEAHAQLKELQAQGADVAQINDQIAAIRVAEQNVRDTAELNRLEERRTNAGAVGMVGGAMAGAAIGSVVPIIGTTIGGLIGGILGQYGGTWLADNVKEVQRTNNSLTSADSVKNPDAAILQIGAAQNRRRQADIAEREKPSYEQQQVDSAIKTSAGASKRRRDADIAERNGTAQVAQQQQEVARLQNIAKQREETAKNFGYSTLGQDYSANATPIMATQRLTAEERSLQQQRQRLSGIIGKQPAAPTRQDFRQPLTTATGYTPAQIYRNDNENAFNISRWFDSLKAKFSGESATPQERNFAQPLAAATTTAALTAAQTPVQNNFDFDAFKSRFVGTETKNLAQPLAANAAYVPNATPYQNLDKSAFNLSKTFDNLKVQFSGAEKSVQERNFAQPLASTQAQVQAQQPMLNLNQDAFNISAAISSLSERFSSPDIAPQDRNYNFNQPMANAPNLNANVPPMGLPNVELPEFNIAEKLSTEFDTISSMATTAWESLTTGASTAFESLSTSIGTGLESAKMTLSTFGEEMSMSLSSGIESLQMSLSTLGTDISTSFGTAFEGVSVMASTTFSSLSTTISGGVEAAKTTITTAFQSAATEVQGVWNAMPGFFSGIFGGLGGIASAAGASIAAGINSGIGMIMSAWDALSGWLSAKIASLSSMAAGAAAAIGIGGNAKGTAYWQGGLTQVNEHGGELIILPSGKQILPYQTTQAVMQETKIAHNAKGTSFFEGGWSEVNEHGGELMYLPTGTQIIPHATTVRILREQIKEKLNDNRRGYANGLAQSGTYGQNVPSIAGTFEPRFAGLEQGKTSSAAGFNNNVLSINNRIRKENATPSALRGVSVNDNGTGFFKQQQRQNSALPALEVNAESNNLRRYENRQSITTNRRFENATAFNDIQSGLSIAHNYTGTSYFKGGLTTVNEHGGEIIALPDGRNILPQYTFQNVFKDSLGNLQGVNIPEYNRITADDSAAVRRAKQDAQYKQLLAQNAVYNSSIKSNQFNRASNIQTTTANDTLNTVQNTVSSEVKKFDGSPFGFRDRTVFNPNAEPSQTSQPPFTRKNRRGIFDILGSIFGIAPRQSRGGVTITRGGIFNRRIPNWNPTISTPPTFPTQQKTPNTMGDIGRRKNRGGIFGGLFDVYKRPTDWILNAASGNVLNSVNSFSGDNQLNQLEELNSFNEGQLGTLPAPEIKLPQAAEPSSKNSTSNNTTNTNSSKVSFNFGGVNINNTANFDEFVHRLMTLFTQGTSNSVQI